MAGIYIHIPFCKQFCTYCDFYSSISLAKKADVLEAIANEMRQRTGFLTDRRVESIYIGGGTPSVCTPAELGRLIAEAGKIFDVSTLKEVTVEANPDDLTPCYFRELRGAGINRLSIGVQSFIDRDLKWMNRRHDSAAARNAVQNAKKAGFENITIDLIYGIPGMTTEEWCYNLEEALKLDVPHISAYHLTFEEGTALDKKFKKGETAPVEDKTSEAQFLMLHSILTDAGYEHYEISNFARKGSRAIHNSNYWNGSQYLGLGPAAHSYNGAQRQWNVGNIPLYLKKQPLGTHFESEDLTPGMRFNEFIMTALRTADGVDPRELEEKFGANKLMYFKRLSHKFIDSGVMMQTPEKYFIPPEKYLVSDRIISELFAD